MIDELTDKEQVALFKKWWKDYGWALLIAIIIGLSLGFGWRYWNQYKLARANSASSMYVSLLSLDPEGDKDQVTKIINELDTSYAKTPYDIFAHFYLAQKNEESKKYDDAIKQLDLALNNPSVANFKDIAQLRKARIMLEMKKYSDAISSADQVVSDAYKPAAQTIVGDVYLAEEKTDEAIAAYTKAEKEYEKLGQMNNLLAMKLAQFNTPSEK